MVAMREFGRLDGAEVREAVLESAAARVVVIGYGARLRDWRVRGGAPVVLGYERLEDYAADRWSMGAIVGRVANRTAHGRFRLGGSEFQLPLNDGAHHLHGGPGGLGRRVWAIEADGAAEAVRLSYASPDGEEGYPGRVYFVVTIRLDGARLRLKMEGRPDRPTPVNLAQHSYYNLGGADVLGYEVEIRADRHTPVGADLIPTGEIAPAPPELDFRRARRMAGSDGAPVPIDANLVLEAGRDVSAPAAMVHAPETGLTLRLWTDQPGLQLFNAPALDASRGLEGRRYEPYGGLCLEAQHFPDSLNHPGFPSIIATPDAPYRQVASVEVS
jgi:aldose 1-epimerase